MLSDTVLLRILVLILHFFQCCGDISMYVELELEAQKDIETIWFTKKRYIYRYLKKNVHKVVLFYLHKCTSLHMTITKAGRKQEGLRLHG